MDGEIREGCFFTTCAGCGARYKPKYFYPTDGTKIVGASDHVCDPRSLRRRERRLRLRNPKDCTAIACKLAYAEELRNEMQ